MIRTHAKYQGQTVKKLQLKHTHRETNTSGHYNALYLAQQWNAGLNLQYLSRLFHQDVVVLKSSLHQATT